MRKIRWISLIILLWLPLPQAQAQGWRKIGAEVDKANTRLAGKIIDHTANHGTDRRIWSRCLFQRRDLYVYLPPGFDPAHHYPLMIWLHGFYQDEKSFLQHIAPVIDAAIQSGKLPPLIVAAPDGSLTGEPHPCKPGSFFLNSDAGDFADFVLYDVFDFLLDHYPIRPERQAHVIAGASMGGFAAFNYGIKHREAFGTVIGLSPPLNLRWQNQKGRYHANFDPKDWGWLMEMGSGHQTVARLRDGGKRVTRNDWFEPLYGYGEVPLMSVSLENPIEMLLRYHLCPGELEMYVGYTGDDEYNIDAQVESFLYLAAWRGLRVGVNYQEEGTHSIFTFKKMLPAALAWLAPRIAPFSPVLGDGMAGHGPISHTGAFAHPKRRPLLGHRHHQHGDDLSCFLPPLWLPDRVEE